MIPNEVLNELDEKVMLKILKRYEQGARGGWQVVNKPIVRDYAAILRSDFYGFLERSFYELNPVTVFKDNWHIEVLAYELERVRLGETKRLIINVPPRSLKSHCASIAFPAWVWWVTSRGFTRSFAPVTPRIYQTSSQVRLPDACDDESHV